MSNYSGPIAIKIMWFFIPFAVCFLIVHQCYDTRTDDRVEASKSNQPAVAGRILQIGQALQHDQYERALTLAEGMEDDVVNNHQLETRWIVRFLEDKGDVHANLWHFVDAKNNYRKAEKTAENNRVRRRLGRKIEHINRLIRQSNDERNKETVYHAMRKTGPGGELDGKVAIICLFLKLENSGAWGVKDRASADRSLQIAKQWLQTRAADYHRSVTFVERHFIVDRSPLLSRIAVKSGHSVEQKYGDIVEIAMKALGQRSVWNFVESVKNDASADHAILLVHINKQKRSFAICCKGACHPYYGEFAMLFETSRASHLQRMSYVIAHESMHLFGADDLYDVRLAKFYHPRDIMNYPSRFLSTSTIDGISAYAVGLLEEKPPTPFDVTEY